MKKPKVDLFGDVHPTPRGWTELDRLRRRYGILTDKTFSGEITTKELEEAHRLNREIVLREEEAREKWKKSFGK
jgi:hypothetical protein